MSVSGSVVCLGGWYLHACWLWFQEQAAWMDAFCRKLHVMRKAER